MGIIDTLRKKGAATADGAKEAKKPAAKKTKKAETTEEVVGSVAPVLALGNALSSSLLRHPHVSEKTIALAANGTYIFDVTVNAEKVAIKKAVEALYKVKVLKVRTIRHAGKPMRRGRRPGARATWKKALVTIAKGQKIEVYEGV